MSTDSIMQIIDDTVTGIYMPPPLKYTPSQVAKHEAEQVSRMKALRKSLIEEAFCS